MIAGERQKRKQMFALRVVPLQGDDAGLVAGERRYGQIHWQLSGLFQGVVVEQISLAVGLGYVAAGRTCAAAGVVDGGEPFLDVAHSGQMRVQLVAIFGAEPPAQALNLTNGEVEHTLAFGAQLVERRITGAAVRRKQRVEYVRRV